MKTNETFSQDKIYMKENLHYKKTKGVSEELLAQNQDIGVEQYVYL
jgi:hypothetical protein